MVVVVPALPEGEQGHQGVVGRGVASGVAAGTVQVAEEVDRGDEVEEERPAQHETDGERGEATQPPGGSAGGDPGHEEPAPEPHELRIARQVPRHPQHLVGSIPFVDQAAEPAEPEALSGTVDVTVGVGVPVVQAVLAGEADRLRERGARQDGQNELERAARPEGVVREVAVKAHTRPHGRHDVEHRAGHPVTDCRPEDDSHRGHGMEGDDESGVACAEEGRTGVRWPRERDRALLADDGLRRAERGHGTGARRAYRVASRSSASAGFSSPAASVMAVGRK